MKMIMKMKTKTMKKIMKKMKKTMKRTMMRKTMRTMKKTNKCLPCLFNKPHNQIKFVFQSFLGHDVTRNNFIKQLI
jgi:hypothetical protein